MEYLIKFGDKQIALSRTDIATLYPALEPFFLAIMQGLNEIQTLKLVEEYNLFRKSLAESRKTKPLTDDDKSPIIEEINGTRKESSPKSAEVYDFNTRRKIS